MRYGVPDPATGVNSITNGRDSSDAAHKGLRPARRRVRGRVRATVGDLRLVIAGRAGRSRRRCASQRLPAGRVGEHVYFTGSVHEEDLCDVATAAPTCSRWCRTAGGCRGEGLPLAALEAAACGLPLVVGDQDGSQEAVIEGENGHVVDPYDLDAHERSIRALARDPGARAEMGATRRARAVREFSYARFVDEHRRLLDEWFGLRTN